MKVLIVRSFPDKLNINSYNVQEIGLAKALVKKGLTCDIVFYNGSEADRTQVLENGIKIYWLKAINLAKNGIFCNLKSIINDYDIIQVHEYDQLQSWLLYTFSKKKVVVYHGPYFDSFNKGYNLKCKVFDTLFLPFSKKAKENVHFMTKSPQATDFLKRKGFKKVTTIGVGLDTDKFASYQNSQVANTDGFNALYIGKLEERRNITFLLELAEKAHAQNPNFKLTIIGAYDSDEYKAKIESKMNELISSGAITYIPKKNQSELPAIYEASDIFLFTTNYDIFGMVLLEAMYYGAVPVSTSNGGSKTLMDNDTDGYILEGFDMDNWLSVINDLAQNKEKLSKLKENAKTKIRDNFTWDSLTQKFIDIYDQT